MTTLAPTQFERIAALARKRWGLCLTEKKIPLVTNRLASYLRSSNFDSIDAYLDHLERDAGEEDLLLFFDVLSTNVTSFFRDKPHFDYLEREFFTPLARGTLTTPGRRIRIWSAACSTGQEPYSLAMCAHDHLPDLSSWDVRILGTDLSNYAVTQARAGVYAADKTDGIPAQDIAKHLVRADASGRNVAIAPHIKSMVSIARLNLMDPWPFKGKFDVIFCRNVMIYFDNDTRRELVSRYHDILHPGGILAVGSAETLAGLDSRFTAVQASIYRRR